MKHIIAMMLLLGASFSLQAQGPPITLDKPIMLAAKQGTFRALYRNANLAHTDFSALILEADYNVLNNLSFGVEVPVILPMKGWDTQLGDVTLMGKFQFIRKDGMGKSSRLAFKMKQSFASGRNLEVPVAGMGASMTYGGFLYAYESLKLGVQSEAGYMLMPSNSEMSYLQYKLGFGIPLLEPTYPVNQINIYAEFEGQWFKGGYNGYYFAPGLQYARGKYTVEASYQFPLSQNQIHNFERRGIFLIGGRIVLF